MGPVLRRLGLAVLAGLVAAGALAGFIHDRFNAPGLSQSRVMVVIPKGAGVARIGGLLERRGIVRSALVFKLGVWVSGKQRMLQAGEYEFPERISARGAMAKLVGGLTVIRRLTVPEGVTTAQAVALINEAYGLSGAVDPLPEEGSLLPDTYHYKFGDSRAELVKRMRKAFRDETERLWKNRAPDLPIRTPEEAVILASIVERETAVPQERSLIAGVFLNRLRRGMALQSDPTVAYGVALKEAVPDRVLRRPLTKSDLAAPHPFNTYRRKGLPPAPIANPGRAAIAAVLNPAETKALFFVADGKGGHLFADTLKAHNRNVRRWRKILKGRNGGRVATPEAPSP